MQDAEKRGLATAAWADDRYELAGGDVETYIAQHFKIAAPAFCGEGLAYPLYPQHYRTSDRNGGLGT